MPATEQGSAESDVAQVTVADVLAAQARLRRFLPPTPLHHAERFGAVR
jgi:threonine dehydratase